MLAFIFPGQGSQSVGMLSELSTRYPLIKETYQEASDVLGYDLWALTENGPEAQLNQTEYTQPALLAASVALFRIWEAEKKEKPFLMAGHSLGEYSALVCANALDYKDAIKLVALRGKFMQAAVKEGEGGMAAIIGLDNQHIEEICEFVANGEILAPANFNAVGQTVIAGQIAAVERAITLAKEKGAKIAKLIPVSVPSHCLLMKPAAEKLKAELTNVKIVSPSIPVVNNVDVQMCEEPDEIKIALIKQLYSPVRWVETIQLFSRMGITHMMECGPGKVLAGLNKRIVETLTTYSFSH